MLVPRASTSPAPPVTVSVLTPPPRVRLAGLRVRLWPPALVARRSTLIVEALLLTATAPAANVVAASARRIRPPPFRLTAAPARAFAVCAWTVAPGPTLIVVPLRR